MQSIVKQLLIVSLFLFFYTKTAQAQTIAPTQTDVIIIDPNGNGNADPGDRIRYKVTIQNTGGPNSTNTQLNVIPDPRTAFVPGSFRSSPLALPDVFACTGNVGISVPAASGLKANDFDDNPAGLTITAGTFTTTGGGSIMIAADGSFMYTPPAGFTGTDTYNYTLNDGNGVGAPVPATDIGTVTVTVSDMIWFVDNNAGAGDGRLGTPFNALSAVNGPAAMNQVIFIKNTGTNYTGGIVLKNGQSLFGTGHTGGANLADAGVLPFVVAANSKTLPAINGTRPVITNATGDGVTLADGNNLRGFDVGACSDFGMENSGTTSVGNLVVSEVGINNTMGGGFDASHGSGASMNAIFSSISSTGGVNGINLTNCAGTFTVNGGTITNPTGTGILISGGSVAFSCAASISDNTGFAVDVDNHDSGNAMFSGNITSTATGIRVQNCGGGTKTFSGNSKSLNTGANAGVTLSSNTGAAINFGGGGLVIATTTGIGFNATGGGTISVTGTGNTINSGTGTALNIASTTIGAGNLNFQSISHNGGANSIVLNTTGATGGLTISGTGSANSGGTIQNTTSHGILLTATISPSFNNLRISGTTRSGIKGTMVNNFSFTNGTIEFSGVTSGGTVVGSQSDSHIAFNDGSFGTPTTLEQSLTGVVTITGNTFNTAYYEGIDLFNYQGTISNANISNNIFTSGATATNSKGSAVRIIASGGAANTANLTKATLDNNVITGFPSGAGIFVSSNNGTPGAPGSTMGIPGSATDIIAITNNRISGFSLATRIGTSAIIYSVNGPNPASRSRGNVNISNNGTIANPLSNIGGTCISASALGNSTVVATINNNFISPNNSVASQGIGAGNSSALSNTDTPNMTITIHNNTISNTDGNGILLVSRDASGSLMASVKNNTVAAPLTGTRPGIRIDCGNSSGLDDAVCLDISGNTSAGSGDPATTKAPGIGFRKQGAAPTINDYGIEGMAATSSPGVENFVNTQNPGSAAGGPASGAVGGTLLISATSGFTNCSSAPLAPTGGAEGFK
jgi:hypothetical protein